MMEMVLKMKKWQSMWGRGGRTHKLLFIAWRTRVEKPDYGQCARFFLSVKILSFSYFLSSLSVLLIFSFSFWSVKGDLDWDAVRYGKFKNDYILVAKCQNYLFVVNNTRCRGRIGRGRWRATLHGPWLFTTFQCFSSIIIFVTIIFI